MQDPRDPKRLVDGFSTLEGGVDTGKAPDLLQTNQLSFGVNVDLRGGFAKPRPGLRKIDLTFPDDIVEIRQKSGLWQVAGYYKPDIGPEVLLASIGGRQFRFNISTDNSVQEITISNQTTTTANFVPPAIGGSVTVPFASVNGIGVGSTILINGNNYTVLVIVGLNVTVENVDDDGSVNPVPSGSPVIFYDPNPSVRDQAWEVQAEKWWILRDGQSLPFIYNGSESRRANSNSPPPDKEIGPGRMMAYGMGRIWGTKTDQRSFVAGDLVFGTSGTAAENFRDAVLKESENTFLNGGGSFTTPMSAGEIVAMRFVATLDSSLGQGPLQVLTPNTIFSVNSPLDRTVWTVLENPIQTISLISYGGLSHYASILVNGDMMYRALDGIRSLILARRDFATWGNTPISREMNRFLNRDTESLLRFSSAVVFNNRMMMTSSPFKTPHGTIHRGWIVLDFDLLSSMGQRSSPVYNGVWIGLNILQIVKGEFNKEEKAYAFSLNAEEEIELFEISRSDKFDHQSQYGEDVPIHWIIETAALLRDENSEFPFVRVLKKLNNLELEIAEVTGEVHFKAYWRPDNYPCWIPWKEWDECAKYKQCDLDPITGCLTPRNYKAQFRPRVSLGEPPNDCDPITNRPLRHGYNFQVRLEVSGYCEIRSLTLVAEKRDETQFAKPVGC